MNDLNHSRRLAARLLAVGILLTIVGNASADVRYVDVNSTNATPPYTNWSTAATNIQDAVDAAVAGNEIVVTNGFYGGGLWVDKPLTLRSVNGSQFTTIDGHGAGRCAYLDDGASLSGFTLTNGASQYYGGAVYGGTLNNCKLIGNSGENGGGAAECTLNHCLLNGNSASVSGGAAAYSTLNNCTLAGNSATNSGGGASHSALKNCLLGGNLAYYDGGGAYSSTLTNCTLTGNSAASGGGAHSSTLRNCIVYFNTAPQAANYDSSCTLNYCCTTPRPTNGAGNIAADPQLASASHLSAASPCRGAGNAAYATGTDIDGESWSSPPAIGCDEYHAGAVTGPLSVTVAASITNMPRGFAAGFTALIDGRTTASIWDFGDGNTATNQPYTSHGWTTLGDYAVVLRAYNDSWPLGISATVTVHVVEGIHYVAANNGHPVAPYTSWATAATNIQDAVDAAVEPGAVVLVTNGTYATGGRGIFGTTNRVAVQRPVSLRSVNGPDYTTIDGGHSNRCVYLTNSASLSGFTLTNGFAPNSSGGGAYGESAGVMISNCVLAGNSAYYNGGGVAGGTLNNCVLSGNSALNGYGGGAYYAWLANCSLSGNSAPSGGGVGSGTLSNCTLIGNSASYSGGAAYQGTLTNCTLNGNWAYYGGGASSSTLNDCTLTNNQATYYYSYYGYGYGGLGGGAYSCTLSNCTLGGNSAQLDGGGANGSTLSNCTLSGNSASGSGGGASGGTLNSCSLSANAASYGGGAQAGVLINCTLTGNSAWNSGGGASASTLNNCIVYYNSAPAGSNYSGGTLDYCCTAPLPADGIGSNNIAAEPQLTDFSHLSAISPCRGAGKAAYIAGVDIDGQSWANPPAIGCDEYHAGALTGPLSVAIQASYTNVVAGFAVSLSARIAGHAASNQWDFADGTLAANRLSASHAWSAPTDYVVVFRAFNQSNPGGVSAALTIHVEQAERYVAWNSANPVAPYLSWTNAAATIQDAIEVSPPGAVIWVNNGSYAPITVRSNLSVRSVNGPLVTDINGGGAAQCASLAADAVLSGFTLTNGLSWYGGGAYGGTLNDCTLSGNSATLGGGAGACTLNDCTLAGNSSSDDGGGASESTLNNCTLTGNSARQDGGGVYRSMLNHCSLIGNSATNYGGGAAASWLTNCLLSGNSAAYGGGASANGGGGYAGLLVNCTLSGNSALSYGGGACYTTVNNSSFSRNSAQYGGGAYGGTLNNCTVTGNSAQYDGGGAYSGSLNNCIIYYNNSASTANANYSSSTLSFCCTTPIPANPDGVTNLSVEPQLADASHLSAGSPCRGAGSSNYVSGVDIDGEPWANPPSIGCDEYFTGAITGALNLAILANYTVVTPGTLIAFSGQINGHASASRWEFDDGTIVSNRAATAHSWAGLGDHAVVLRAFNDTYPLGVATTLTIRVVTPPVHYVALGSANPMSPYTNWATAARTIQDAVDATTVPGALVLVTNGTYAVGGRAVYGTITNRVAVDKPLTLRSVNGPQLTIIQGRQAPGTTNGDEAIRCVYLANGASLYGFTLTQGATRAVYDAPTFRESAGGGLWCESTNGVAVSNCVVAGNSAYYYGGGAYQARLNNCTLSGNSALSSFGGGACASALNHCTLTGNSAYYGGGAYASTLSDSTLSGNSAVLGGGASGGTLNHCALDGNSGAGAFSSILNNCTLTGNPGGGAYSGTLNNCALTGNSGVGAASSMLTNCTLTGNSGGASSSTLANCIVYFNANGNYDSSCALNYCCATPLPTNGVGNISSDPQLAGTWRLSVASPCRGAGNTAYATGTDLDDEPWANPPAIGCDEYHTGALTGLLTAGITADFTSVAVGYPVELTAQIQGRASANVWDFGDGSTATNEPYLSHAWRTSGDYAVVLRVFNESQPGGVSATVTVHVVRDSIHYVAAGSASPVAPYTSWATAAVNIQDAVDAASAGALVLVTNGLYATGGRVAYGSLLNRVAVNKPLTLRSINGPPFTMIQGHQVPGTTNGDGAIRCVYLTNGASLSGFTLTNGATRGVYDFREGSGGGLWCESTSAGVVSNCVVSGNAAYQNGGGAYQVVLDQCTLSGNSAQYSYGGGAYGSTLNNCTLRANSAYYLGGGASDSTLNDCTVSGNQGGGAIDSTLNNCALTGNSGSGANGCTLNNCALTDNTDSGAVGCTLNNCTLTGNSATYYGGGAVNSTLNKCTISSNSVTYYSSFYYYGEGSGGGVSGSTLTNCTITGNTANYGGGAWSSTLNNCTLAGNSAPGYGGGAGNSILNNCLVTGNSSTNNGGGAYGCTLINSALSGNSAPSGGGAINSALTNCTLVGNSAGSSGGGASSSTLDDCIVFFNTAPQGANYDSYSTLNYCCTMPLPNWGAGNISSDPQLAGTSHLSAISPCRGAGSSNYVSGVDIDGEAWANPPSIGCDEYHAGAVTGPLTVAIVATLTNVVAGYPDGLTALIQGRTTASVWDFGDGATVTNQPAVSHAWASVGDYTVVVHAYNESTPGGVTGALVIHVIAPPIHYVAAASSNSVAPYISWATAATNIQDAVDAVTVPGAIVQVTNGIYASGGRAVYGTMANRVAVYKPLALRSVNGPQFTVIQGYQMPGTTNGDGAVRCVYLTNGASLSGFTLTNGATRVGYDYRESAGGGLWCESTNAVAVSNCVVVGNAAYQNGGGAYQGTLDNSTVSGNSAYYLAGGAYQSTLNNCTLRGNWAQYSGGASGYSGLSNCTLSSNSAGAFGGAAVYGSLNNCTLSGNAAGSGGGAGYCTLNNCALSDNSAGSGGGAYGSMLTNCTLSANSASYGGGAEYSVLNNCITYFNTAPQGANYDSSCTLNYCCATPLPSSGVGNISSDPQLASAAHLSAASPCRGAGNAAYASGTDIDGEAWATPPSIGCDEYHADAETGPLTLAIIAAFTNVAVGYEVELTGLIQGQATDSVWEFGDGFIELNELYTSHSWAAPGDYLVALWAFNESHPRGVSRTITVHVVAQPVHYVAATSINPLAPHTSWATAATNIQDAVDAATLPGALVLVADGTYAAGGRATAGSSITNRVTVDKGLPVRSVSGPQSTIIDGGLTFRCVYLSDQASLSGFTLTNGAGVAAYGGTLNNCVLRGNSSGASSSTLNNCALIANSGLGASGCTLNNCTLSGNVGGGASSSILNNCISYFNQGANFDTACTLNYCCTTPRPTNGVGNISLDPQLASASHLSAASPCRRAGSAAYASGTDIDGEAWANPPSLGCDEYYTGAVTGPLKVGVASSYTNVAVGFAVQLTALIEGRTSASVWDFGDGITVTNEPYTSHAWTTPGDYAVILRAFNETQPAGLSATVIVNVVAGVHYAKSDSGNPVAPYNSWATAARDIQLAINVATEPGAQVAVSSGVYGPITVRSGLTVRSVNGPHVTTISGNGYSRCAHLASGASLSGFTLSGGQASYGAGMLCDSRDSMVFNCVISGNGGYSSRAGTCRYGGGAYGGTLNNCILRGNSVEAGGSRDDIAGGGAAYCTLNNCTLAGNSAIPQSYSYCVYWCYSGGEPFCCKTGTAYSPAYGGGAYQCVLNNSIVTDSTYGATLNHCWTADPLFADYSNLRLQSNSPCINFGDNTYAVGSTDLDGRPRIVGGKVDIGAYEYQGQGLSGFIAWLAYYGLPTDGLADFADWDGDGLSNWQEWVAGTDPTDPASALRVLPPVLMPAGLLLRWNGDTNHAYFAERTTSLKPPITFTRLRSNVAGLSGTTTFTDTTPPATGAAFYRIGTESTNASSALWLQPPLFVPARVVARWTSVTNRSYFLERATNLAVPTLFTPLAMNIPGQSGTTTYADTNAVGPGPWFYRVGVTTP